MIELHERFEEWLVAGASGDPPRDLALHASGCDACLRAAAAFDALQAVDVGAAPLPPTRLDAPRRADGLPGMARAAASAVGALVVGTALVIGASSLLGSDPPGTGADRSPGEGVLAGGPSTEPSESGSPTATPSPSPSPTASALSTPAAIIQPTQAPRTLAPAPAPAPPPTSVPAPLPTTPAPLPTSTPTSAPTATPSPTATPTPFVPSPSPSPSVDPSASAPPSSPEVARRSSP